MAGAPVSSQEAESSLKDYVDRGRGLRLCKGEYVALAQALRGVKGRALIFGSRTHLNKRGGDIDLLVEADTESSYRLTQDITVRFRMQCDEKIDVFVVNPSHVDPSDQLFYKSIRDEAILFYQGD